MWPRLGEGGEASRWGLLPCIWDTYLFYILLHNQARNISWSSDTVTPNSRISVPDKRGGGEVSGEKIREHRLLDPTNWMVKLRRFGKNHGCQLTPWNNILHRCPDTVFSHYLEGWRLRTRYEGNSAPLFDNFTQRLEGFISCPLDQQTHGEVAMTEPVCHFRVGKWTCATI